MTFANSWSSNIPAVETKGGTGNAAYVVGDMLYSDATNNLARRAIGANGEVLTVSAGVPVWAVSPAAGPGTLTLLNSSTVTNVTSVSWGNTIITAAFDVYWIRWYNVIGSADNILMAMRFSSDNGATWISGAADYNFGRQDNATSGSDSSNIQLATIAPYLSKANVGDVFVNFPLSTVINTTTFSKSKGANTNFVQAYMAVGGMTKTAVVVAHDAMQIIPTTGTMSGIFEIYGQAF